MSNHSGSYMSNQVISIAKDMGIFEVIDAEKLHQFALEIIKIARRYECNNSEILDDAGKRLGICCCCLKESYELDYSGICRDCGGEFDYGS